MTTRVASLIELPFTLLIQRHQNNEMSVTIFQRPFPARRNEEVLELESISGLPLALIQDDLLAALRVNHHKPAALKQRKAIGLSEVSGIRLALLFRATSLLSTVDAIRAMQQGIATMSDEETYYWFAKCYGEYAQRATQALQILHGAIGIESK